MSAAVFAVIANAVSTPHIMHPSLQPVRLLQTKLATALSQIVLAILIAKVDVSDI